MSSDFNKSGMDNYLKELAKEYRRMVGKNMPAEIVLVGGAAQHLRITVFGNPRRILTP